MIEFGNECSGCVYFIPGDQVGFMCYCSYLHTYRDRDMISECTYYSKYSDSEKCLLSEVCSYYNLSDFCYELETIRNFRDTILANSASGQQLIDHYYETSPILLTKIKNLPDKESLYGDIYIAINKIVSLIEAGDNTSAIIEYSLMLLDVQEKCSIFLY